MIVTIMTLSIKTHNTGMLSVTILNVVYTECSRLGPGVPKACIQAAKLTFFDQKSLYNERQFVGFSLFHILLVMSKAIKPFGVVIFCHNKLVCLLMKLR